MMKKILLLVLILYLYMIIMNLKKIYLYIKMVKKYVKLILICILILSYKHHINNTIKNRDFFEVVNEKWTLKNFI